MSGLGIVFIAIQFFRPVLNKSNQVPDTDISKMVPTSDSVLSVLKNSCYDCHSNNTSYSLYSRIQPVGWLMARHIRKGKDELNFSEFGGYSPRRQLSKLNGIANSIRDNIMPLLSYKMMHKNAQLSTNEKALLIYWAQRARDSLSVKN
jgi:Haem-binding domain